MRDSPLLLQEIDSLRKLFHQERNERIKLQNAKLKKQLDQLAPLPSFKNIRDELIEELFKEGAALKQVMIYWFSFKSDLTLYNLLQEILMSLAKPIVPQIYKLKPGSTKEAFTKHFTDQRQRIAALKMRAQQFQDKVAREVVKRKYGGRINADFTVFPTKEMAKVSFF